MLITQNTNNPTHLPQKQYPHNLLNKYPHTPPNPTHLPQKQ